MSDSNTVMDQHLGERRIGGGTYVAIDGLLKYCITAPLLELPIDFKEWYKPTGSNMPQLYQV
ncbi:MULTISPECIES: hypothetical protein [Methylomonas]|uniref:Uncharacterized protein n=2 Tax=Methylomonas TaxID=416 RepID=A0A126T0Y4_9GAMM|nr:MULTISPECIES: hypothetical protein [Methylomonas]AMK75745.1 hypothetical protein JT25_004470 [Methylomonas denitrificans]OAH98261.1 hypothetical protein A1342_14805 [Methylomonas methanica]TCV82428.1 hypothetical protein EDE11_11323 [Methylomonas methanica]